jgi:hypothetical protein
LPAHLACAKLKPVSWTAECACGRLRVTVEGEPIAVATCHCEFCQRRTGSVFQVSAVFSPDQKCAITGEATSYNGLEINGVGTTNGDDVTYHFCPTCGSTVFWTFKDRPTIAIAVGCFADAAFPTPTLELHVPLRHPWVPPVDGAAQFESFRPRSVN